MICTGEADRNQTHGMLLVQTSISYCIHFHTCSLRASFGVGHRLSYVQTPRDSSMYSQTRHSAFRYTWRFSRHLQCSKHEPCCWSTCLSLRMLKGGRATSIAIRLKNSLQTMSRPHHRRSLIAICFFPKAAAKGSFKKSAVIKHCYQTLPKVLLKWWLSWKIVIKDCPKFCWSDGCP